MADTCPWIETIESHLNFRLPEGLRDLYLNSDGEQRLVDERGFPSSDAPAMRLMSATEVCEVYDQFNKHTRLRGSCPFWQDGKGSHDYAAVYLSGALVGRVYFWTYDGRNDSVAYRTAGSFVGAMQCEPGKDWYQLPSDYYVDTSYYLHGKAQPTEASKQHLAADAFAKTQLELEYSQATIKDELDVQHYEFNLMALIPEAETRALLPFLESDDMWVQERACSIIGNRRSQWAIPHLISVVERGLPNGLTAALRALGKIGTAEARTAILQAARSLDHGNAYSAMRALKDCGCETRSESEQHFYRLQGAETWHKIETREDNI